MSEDRGAAPDNAERTHSRAIKDLERVEDLRRSLPPLQSAESPRRRRCSMQLSNSAAVRTTLTLPIRFQRFDSDRDRRTSAPWRRQPGQSRNRPAGGAIRFAQVSGILSGVDSLFGGSASQIPRRSRRRSRHDAPANQVDMPAVQLTEEVFVSDIIVLKEAQQRRHCGRQRRGIGASAISSGWSLAQRDMERTQFTSVAHPRR